MTSVIKIFISLMLCLLFAAVAYAKTLQYGSALDSARRIAPRVMISQISSLLRAEYVFSEKVDHIICYLHQRDQDGHYTEKQGNALAMAFSADLQMAANDAHLNLRFSEQPITAQQDQGKLFEIPKGERKALALVLKIDNYGLRSMRVLKGNIGYLDIAYFCDPELSSEIYRSAMACLNHTDALIIDLRNCNGSSSPEAVPDFAGHFFKDKVTLSELHYRDGSSHQFFTRKKARSFQYLRKPVYILTSRQTFSGAEEFAYDMQALSRAKVTGQPTRGGANPGRQMKLNDHFSLFVPIAVAHNPLTGANWEGSGVEPDILIESHLALHKTLDLIYNELLAETKSSDHQQFLEQCQLENLAGWPRMQKVDFFLKGFQQNQQVSLMTSFNYFLAPGALMRRAAGGWSCSVEVPEGDLSYRFLIDGKSILDPENPITKSEGKYINSYRNIKGSGLTIER